MHHSLRASSQLAVTEVVRALAPHGERYTERARELLDGMYLVPVTGTLLLDAGLLPGPYLRSLDAIHVTSARLIGATTMVTYDQRLADAAQLLGVRAAMPGARYSGS